MLVAIGLWFVPMMLATAAGGDLLAYRNEILFEQTVTRYAGAWHHREPPWYYLTRVIPVLWLPLIALVPWLWPRWRAALRGRDTFVAVLLAWVALVLVFFSASSGKRGVYVAFGLAVLLAALAALGAAYFAFDAGAAERIVRDFGIHPVLPLVVAAVAAAIPMAWLRPRDGWLAYAGALVAMLLTIGTLINPRIDSMRSGRAFMSRVEQASREPAAT